MAEHAVEEAAARATLEYSRAARRNLALRWSKAFAAYLVLTVFAVIAIGPFTESGDSEECSSAKTQIFS